MGAVYTMSFEDALYRGCNVKELGSPMRHPSFFRSVQVAPQVMPRKAVPWSSLSQLYLGAVVIWSMMENLAGTALADSTRSGLAAFTDRQVLTSFGPLLLWSDCLHGRRPIPRTIYVEHSLTPKSFEAVGPERDVGFVLDRIIAGALLGVINKYNLVCVMIQR